MVSDEIRIKACCIALHELLFQSRLPAITYGAKYVMHVPGPISIVVNPVEMYSSLTGSIRPYTLERGTARLDCYSPPAPFLLIP
jgi:hypothetical protein